MSKLAIKILQREISDRESASKKFKLREDIFEKEIKELQEVISSLSRNGSR